MTSGQVESGPANAHAPAILIVDDDILVRFVSAEILREEGYRVLEAADASEALALLKTGQPVDLVLSDVRMPGSIDGLTLARTVKEMRPHLPVALVTSHLPPDTVHMADGFLAKPYAVPQLLEIVAQMIGPERKCTHSSPIAS